MPVSVLLSSAGWCQPLVGLFREGIHCLLESVVGADRRSVFRGKEASSTSYHLSERTLIHVQPVFDFVAHRFSGLRRHRESSPLMGMKNPATAWLPTVWFGYFSVFFSEMLGVGRRLPQGAGITFSVVAAAPPVSRSKGSNLVERKSLEKLCRS